MSEAEVALSVRPPTKSRQPTNREPTTSFFARSFPRNQRFEPPCFFSFQKKHFKTRAGGPWCATQAGIFISEKIHRRAPKKRASLYRGEWGVVRADSAALEQKMIRLFTFAHNARSYPKPLFWGPGGGGRKIRGVELGWEGIVVKVLGLDALMTEL